MAPLPAARAPAFQGRPLLKRRPQVCAAGMAAWPGVAEPSTWEHPPDTPCPPILTSPTAGPTSAFRFADVGSASAADVAAAIAAGDPAAFALAATAAGPEAAGRAVTEAVRAGQGPALVELVNAASAAAAHDAFLTVRGRLEHCWDSREWAARTHRHKPAAGSLHPMR